MYSSLYTFMVKNLYPGEILRRRMHELEQSQWLSRPQLEAIQLKRIQKLVSYAYENVPYYRQCYQREGIHPQDIKGFKDFQALPYLTREDVKNHGKDLMAIGYRGPIFEGKTSGSTGTPMEFVMEKSTIWLTFAFNTRGRGWYGVKPGDKRAFLTATLEDYPNWPWRQRLIARIKRNRYLNVRTMTESKMKNFADMLVKWQPNIIRAYPSSLAVFAHYLKEKNISGINPKLVETTAEKVTPSQKQLFEEVFQAPVADHYASLEIYSYAYQCPDGGLHVNEDRHIELVENGQIVSPGQMGEVIVTALNQYAMPFIRYKNGDVAIYKSNGCTCGRGLPALREVVGRNCDLLVHPKGHVVHYVAITLAIRQYKVVRKFQIYQPDRKNLEVRLVSKDKIDENTLESIRNDIQPFFGESMQIGVKQVDHVELTSGGKYRHVISEVKPDFMVSN